MSAGVTGALLPLILHARPGSTPELSFTNFPKADSDFEVKTFGGCQAEWQPAGCLQTSRNLELGTYLKY